MRHPFLQLILALCVGATLPIVMVAFWPWGAFAIICALLLGSAVGLMACLRAARRLPPPPNI